MTYEAETALLPHYTSHLDYGSPLDGHGPSELCAAVGIYDLEGRVLDVGCGDGRLAAALPGLEVVGVDYCAERIAKAEARGLPNAVFLLGDVWAYARALESGPTSGLIRARRYPLIFAVEVLEHLARPRRMVGILRRLLAPGGSIVATVPRCMAYKAHLQVFATVEQVHDQLEPDRVSEALGRHWVLRWDLAA